MTEKINSSSDTALENLTPLDKIELKKHHRDCSTKDNLKECMFCGNLYDKTFEIKYSNESYIFDCFECAIFRLAPKCTFCGCIIIGHGVEDNSREFYCSAHCAKEKGLSAKNSV